MTNKNNQKTNIISFRITQTQKGRLIEESDFMNISASEYIIIAIEECNLKNVEIRKKEAEAKESRFLKNLDKTKKTPLAMIVLFLTFTATYLYLIFRKPKKEKNDPFL